MARTMGGPGAVISGKVDNLVFYQRGRGTYVRRYTKPKNPNTVPQQAQRGRFAAAVAAWKGLSAEARADWQQRARRERRTGYAMFVGQFLAQQAAPAAEPPPGRQGRPGPATTGNA